MTEIDRWIQSGAGVQEGLRLLDIYRPNTWLSLMIRRHPEKYRQLLVRTLSGMSREETASIVSGSRRFREQWPFLSDPDCPAELKILAADKITAWREYAEAHDALFLCTTDGQCLDTAKKCVFSYCQNRKIYSEFAYYKEHRFVLGKHPVFAETARIRELRSAGPVELMRRRRRLQDSVWRIRKLIRQGDRPDLEIPRTELVMSKERELSEVEKLLQSYEA